MANHNIEELTQFYHTSITTPIGSMYGCASQNGLVSLKFSEEKSLQSCYADLKNSFKNDIDIIQDKNSILIQTQKEITEYFNGERKEFTIPLEPSGTDFQIKVWNALRLISYGKTETYKDLSRRLGDTKNIRAAAGANGKNNIAIIIPCHRVIGSNGKLTGYAWGLDKKNWLLDFEAKNQNKYYQSKLWNDNQTNTP